MVNSCTRLAVRITTVTALLLIIGHKSGVNGQYGPHNYPDPRTDPLSCHNLLPSQICDPSDILTLDERRMLNDKILQFQQLTSNVRNVSPQCASFNRKSSNLYIAVALMDRMGAPDTVVDASTSGIERFANQLRARYANYRDVTQCDTFVLIVNSKLDRQVFTVAGRDARLSREILQNAFHRHVGYFRAGKYALGLEGMVEFIISSYTSMHLVHIPSSADAEDKSAITNSLSLPFVSAQGVRQRPDSHRQNSERFALEAVPEGDRLWVEVMLKASALCGYDADKMANNVRAVVEDTMALSLKLISDTRYNKIEEASQDTISSTNSRDKAWTAARSTFIDRLYETYGSRFPRRADHCPRIETAADSAMLKLMRK